MSKKIFIIDDDMDLSMQLAESLRDDGHTVDVCLFDRQEPPRLTNVDYDVIILDFKMPGVNGTDLLKDIRNKCSRAKIFLISGRPFVESILEQENLFHLVHAIIPKPFPIVDLLAKIKAL